MDIEGAARWLLRGLGDVPGARAVVRQELGDGAVDEVRTLPTGDAAAFERGGRWRIRVRQNMAPERLRWALVHEAVEVHLARAGHVGLDTELLAERITGAVVMPRAAFIREAWAGRMSLDVLATRFVTSQTAVALRFAEVALVQGAAVVHPHFRFERGELHGDPRRTLRKTVTDAPRRFALLAS